MELTICDDLMELHATAKPLVNKGCSIAVMRERGGASWLSGNPYEFSAFNDRAFVFADRAEAQAFIDRHRERFDKYQKTRIVYRSMASMMQRAGYPAPSLGTPI